MRTEEPSLFPDLEPVPLIRNGLLPSQDIRRLIQDGVIRADTPLTDQQIQPASLDLRLGPKAYRVHASFLPGRRSTVQDKVQSLQMHDTLDLTRPCLLERGCVYIIPLMEHLHLPPNISARANPKSTTGRLDVFTRLITDRCPEFDEVRVGYEGPLFVEVVPRTFGIVVEQGTQLNQIRFRRGGPSTSDRQLDSLHREEALVFHDNAPAPALIDNGLWVHVDLSGTQDSVIGYRARQGRMPIELSRIGAYSTRDYWEPVLYSSDGLVLHPDEFYILMSKEQVRVPPNYAAEMVAYETAVGEFRVHYAGFFDPGFGHGAGLRGTRAVLEVRSHEVPFLMEDGQIVGRLLYERMLDIPDRLYGRSIGSSYQSQSLQLSKQFRMP